MPTPDTKERILDAAERLFATRGFAATSLRTVIAAAEVNLAAVHYHFGSKEGLIRAVFARRLDPMNAERLRMLDAIESAAGDQAPPVEKIMDSFIRPAAGLATATVDGIPILGSLFGRAHTEPGFQVKELLIEQFAEIVRRYVEVLTRALPELSIEELLSRFHFVIGAMAATLAERERLIRLSQGDEGALPDMETLAVYLIKFLSAGLAAPPTIVDGSGARARKSSGAPKRRGGRRSRGGAA